LVSILGSNRQELSRKEMDIHMQSQCTISASEKLSRLQHDYLALVEAHEVGTQTT
jgi:hypothetical protein